MRHRVVLILGLILMGLPAMIRAQSGEGYQRPYRARDLGIRPGIFEPGPWNAITDVAGVRVGYRTLIKGNSIRTGVTVILPHPGNLFREKVPAAVVVGNGFGKMVGVTQIMELGEVETPIVLTNTLSVFAAAQGLLDFMLKLPGNERVRSINPVVAECNDGWLNDIRRRAVKPKHVREALERATSGPVAEGAVGAGTGMMALGWKGGVGTASRRLPDRYGGWTLGVLVLANFGGILEVDGVPVGREVGRVPFQRERDMGGSVIVVLATDAPLMPNELRRLARRAFLGIARTGSFMSHGSGDYALAFSTHPGVRRISGSPAEAVVSVRHGALSPLFQATVEATMEAVYNALLRAGTVQGYQGHVGEALPYELLVRIGKKYGRDWTIPDGTKEK